jgi:hypothetical protein
MNKKSKRNTSTQKNYDELIASLLNFMKSHGRTPNGKSSSSKEEQSLYNKWYKLDKGLVYKQYYSIEDKKILSEAGICSIKKQNYEKLKRRIVDFINQHHRTPKMMSYKNTTTNEKREEYLLAKSLYDLKSGNTYLEFLSTQEIEFFEHNGIDMQL